MGQSAIVLCPAPRVPGVPRSLCPSSFPYSVPARGTTCAARSLSHCCPPNLWAPSFSYAHTTTQNCCTSCMHASLLNLTSGSSPVQSIPSHWNCRKTVGVKSYQSASTAWKGVGETGGADTIQREQVMSSFQGVMYFSNDIREYPELEGTHKDIRSTFWLHTETLLIQTQCPCALSKRSPNLSSSRLCPLPWQPVPCPPPSSEEPAPDIQPDPLFYSHTLVNFRFDIQRLTD